MSLRQLIKAMSERGLLVLFCRYIGGATLGRKKLKTILPSSTDSKMAQEIPPNRVGQIRDGTVP